MSIKWNKVTRLSQLIAIILGVLIFFLGFWFGMQYPKELPTDTKGLISDVTYTCDKGENIHALFYDDKVTLTISTRTYNLPHVISASGARYASEDESIVFWEKGKNAALTEGVNTFSCTEEPPLPQ